MSKKKLGMAANINNFSASATINQYENGTLIPDFLTLKKIAKYYQFQLPISMLKIVCWLSFYFYMEKLIKNLENKYYNFVKI